MGYSPSVAGLYILPKVASVSCGSILSGIYMSRTGEYRKLTTVAAFVSLFSMLGYSAWVPATRYPFQFLCLLADGTSMGVIITTTLIAMHSCVETSGKLIFSSKRFYFYQEC